MSGETLDAWWVAPKFFKKNKDCFGVMTINDIKTVERLELTSRPSLELHSYIFTGQLFSHFQTQLFSILQNHFENF